MNFQWLKSTWEYWSSQWYYHQKNGLSSIATKLSSSSYLLRYMEDTDLYPHKWSAEILYCATELSLIEHWSLLFKKSTRTLSSQTSFHSWWKNTIENISQKLYLFITWQIKEEIKSSLIAQIFWVLLRNVMVKSCLSQE